MLVRSWFVRLTLILVGGVPALGLAQGADGAAVYSTMCAGCHQASGAGIAGVFPPLAGNVVVLHEAEGGRRYLLDAVLFGVQGAITVDGVTYDGIMPSWFQLADGDIAAVLNYVMTAWDEPAGFEPYAEDDVATARRGGLSAAGVHGRRPISGDGLTTESVELPLATFTAAQVERARSVYGRLCAECHGDTFTGGLIGGPPLRGGQFLQRWGGRSVAPLFSYTRQQMPQGGAGGLSGQQYADLIAMILDANGHEAGDVELRPDLEELDRVRIREP